MHGKQPVSRSETARERPKSAAADVLVVGAGPAGLMAAISAAGGGAAVKVLEQLRQPGTKLLATGGGHCNLTNTLDLAQLVARFAGGARFVKPALAAMDSQRLRGFLAGAGVKTCCEDGFHVFPVSGRAASVRQALVKLCRSSGVALDVETRVSALWMEDGRLKGLRTGKNEIAAPRVVLATGGRSYRELGATGEGYEMARQAGHAIVEPVPALVPLLTREKWVRGCAGVSVAEAHVRIDLPGFGGRADVGGLLFTHRGISGPAALDVSGEVSALLAGHRTVPVSINLAPGTPVSEWLERFRAWQKAEGKKRVHNLLGRYLPASLAGAVCGQIEDGGRLRAAEFSKRHRLALAGLISSLPLTVTGTEGFANAMVTRGGVSLDEVNPRLLESRIVKGLYFAGEILDVDGPCGGFNLQWAFSSGHLAGLSAAQGACR